jgi:hypothetical protein
VHIIVLRLDDCQVATLPIQASEGGTVSVTANAAPEITLGFRISYFDFRVS